MDEVINIFPKLAMALLAAGCFVSLKRLAERRLLSSNDAPEVAWTLILISCGLMTGYSRAWTTNRVAVTIAWDLLLVSILAAIHRRSHQARARFTADGVPAPSVAIVEGFAEVSVGLAAVVMVVR